MTGQNNCTILRMSWMLCGAGRPGTKDGVDALSFFVSEFKEEK